MDCTEPTEEKVEPTEEKVDVRIAKSGKKYTYKKRPKKHCDLCNRDITYNHYPRHLRSKEHTLLVDIQRLVEALTLRS